MEFLADLQETQAVFEELQFELQEFLVQHISKVAALQGRIVGNANIQRASNGEAHVSHGTGMTLRFWDSRRSGSPYLF